MLQDETRVYNGRNKIVINQYVMCFIVSLGVSLRCIKSGLRVRQAYNAIKRLSGRFFVVTISRDPQ
jgi:hypothetical protein